MQNTTLPFDDRAFQKIIAFYLFQCPVCFTTGKGVKKTRHRVSELGQSLHDLGWEAGAMQKLTYHLREGVDSHKLKNSEDVENSYKLFNKQSVNTRTLQYAYFKKCGELSESASILYYIRCGFAHGAFERESINDKIVYRFASRKENQLNGFLQVYESTLLEWISFIQAGQKKRTT